MNALNNIAGNYETKTDRAEKENRKLTNRVGNFGIPVTN